MLRSDDYDLGTGLWIVFAGRFDTQESAERQAANLVGALPRRLRHARQADELTADQRSPTTAAARSTSSPRG